MAAFTGDSRIPIGTTIADIKISVCVAFPFWIPSTDTTDTGIAVVVACRVRDPDITEPSPHPVDIVLFGPEFCLRWIRKKCSGLNVSKQRCMFNLILMK